jgi:hypothetical protein
MWAIIYKDKPYFFDKLKTNLNNNINNFKSVTPCKYAKSILEESFFFNANVSCELSFWWWVEELLRYQGIPI